jgi:signal transduction histidine kinase
MTVLGAFSYQPAPSQPHLSATPIPLSEFVWADYVDKTFDLVREQPELLYIECGITRVLNTRKEPEGYLVVFRDVTDIRKTISAAHRLTNFLSHKLRTPMVALQAIPLILLDQKDGNSLTDHQRRNIEIVLKNCRAIGDRVEDIIAFSCLAKEQMQTTMIPVAALIEKAKTMLVEDFPDRVDHVYFDPCLAQMRVNVDPRRMSIAFCHLLENAFKFGATEVHVSAEIDGDGVPSIRFTDDGHGVPPQDRERIFDPFYQIDKTFVGNVPGMGLGLSVVREIIEAHDGKVLIESGREKGAVLVVNLAPLAWAA